MVRLRVPALAALSLAALLAFAPRGLAASTAVAPTAGKTVVVSRVRGAVRIRLPGRGYKALHGPTVVPLRTIVDALRGVVRLKSADGTGIFYQGAFQVFEPKVAPAGAGKGRLTDLRLFGGDFSSCPPRKLAGASLDDKPIRRLWGNAKGRFRTKGRFAAATVRGTVWLTEDSCTGSGVTVRKGVVGVRDLVHNTTVSVPAGKSYDAEVNLAPVNTAPPTIAGTVIVGQTLTASPGTWTGKPAPTFAYQWQRCDATGAGCIDIAGATGITYVVQGADAGATLRVRVAATNVAGSASATSAATGGAATAPANTTRPSIGGTVTPGSVLTAAVGTWSGVPAPTFALQWERCDPAGNACVAIVGATAQTYTTQSADIGFTVRVQVTATNSAGSANATSPAVGPIRPNITIGDVSMDEGPPIGSNATTTNFVFTVTLSAASTQTVTVAYATANDTADSKDYTTTSGTLTFAPGQTSRTITVVVVADRSMEPNDRFFVNLSNPVNASLVDAQAIGTIVNDDTS